MSLLAALANLARFFATHPLTRDRPSRAWARFIGWQLRSRLREEVIVPWIGGRKLAARRGMLGATGNIYVGLHEFADMMLPLHLLREGDLFLDVGANIGSYTILAAGVRGASVLAFEPDPGTARLFQRNVEINGLAERVRLMQCALGPEKGEARFTIGLDTANRVARAGDADVRLAPQERLDDLIGERRPVMMKIDVEGYEEEMLKGAAATLARESLVAVELETVTPMIEATMAAHGFERAYYDPFARALRDAPCDAFSLNTLFIRDRPFVEARLESADAVEIFGRLV